MSTKIYLAVFSVLIVYFFLTMDRSADLLAATPDKVDLLEDRISQLEQRVAKLEGLKKANSETQEAESGSTPIGGQPWLDESNWSKIKIGMSFDQVIRILGQPTRRENSDGTGYWYYEGFSQQANANVTGNIFFHNSRVLSRDVPVF